MEIKVNLNNLKFRYEVYQLFNVYYPMKEIKFLEKQEAEKDFKPLKNEEAVKDNMSFEKDEEVYIFYIDEEILRFEYKDYYKEESLGEDIKNSLRRFLFLCLKNIKEKLLPLGDNIEVYAGHGPASTIGYEKRRNPFL